MGLKVPNVYNKVLGYLPKFEGANVKITADLEFFEAELSADFVKGDKGAKASLHSLILALLRSLSKIDFSRQIFMYFDELETFFHSPEQNRRDQRMVRDLLFSIQKLNDNFRDNGKPIHLIAAVRSEVIDAMGSLGQEVDRLVHDKGFHISWHHSNKSMHHPLIEMIRRKLRATWYYSDDVDPIGIYFTDNVNGESLVTFLLDRSFYKPRDIMWRLTIAQRLFPDASRFTDHVLRETESEYSSKLWDEIKYELSATYSDDEVGSLERTLVGGPEFFEIGDIERRFSKASLSSPIAKRLIERRSALDILTDLYRLGAVGNAFRAGQHAGSFRNRWAFRGDVNLIADKRMQIHPALIKRLSVIRATR